MINPVAANIENLLSSYQFEVPKFQRGYEWRETHATEYWEDLESYIGQKDGGPFLGTFIFIRSPKDQTKLTIIDGQQRITTILLFLIACRTVAKEMKNHALAHEIQRKITFIDPATAQSRGSRLVASQTIKDAFEVIAQSDWRGDFIDVSRRQVSRIKPVYDYFNSQIEKHKEKLSDLLRAVLNTHVVRIDIENEMEAFDVFERTNARGVDLEIADLLKNYLFKKDVKELGEKWERIVQNADGNSVRMLKYFYVAKKGPVRKPELFKRLKRYEEQIGAELLTDELVEFSLFYKQARTANIDGVKETLRLVGAKAIAQDQEKLCAVFASLEGLRLFKIFQVYPLLYSALKAFAAYPDTKKAKLVVRLFEVLEKYHFINNSVCERIGNQVEKLYGDFCVRLNEKGKEHFEAVSGELIDALKKQLAPQDEFVARFVKLNYEARELPRLMYIFDRMNNVGLPASQRLRIFYPEEMSRRNWNIEHFSPRKPKGTSEKINGVDNIGNLLPLDFRTNSALNNRDPQQKLEWLQKDGNQKKIENISYVREFIQKYRKVAAKWDDKIIETRARDMAKDAYEFVWKI
jgi:Protein of unknown function DUF262/Protein of unknown function (DUF1524)